MNAIARTIGSSIAAAIVALLLARSTNGYTPESSYTLIFGSAREPPSWRWCSSPAPARAAADRIGRGHQQIARDEPRVGLSRSGFTARRGWVRRGRRAHGPTRRPTWPPGDGALRTWETLPSRAITKSSTSDPSRPTACARPRRASCRRDRRRTARQVPTAAATKACLLAAIRIRRGPPASTGGPPARTGPGRRLPAIPPVPPAQQVGVAGGHDHRGGAQRHRTGDVPGDVHRGTAVPDRAPGRSSRSAGVVASA